MENLLVIKGICRNANRPNTLKTFQQSTNGIILYNIYLKICVIGTKISTKAEKITIIAIIKFRFVSKC